MYLISILLMSMITLVSYSQDRLAFHGSIGYGYSTGRTIIYPNTLMAQQGFFPSYDLNAMYGKLRVSANYKGLSLYTSNKTYFNKDHGLNYVNVYFDPMQSEFEIGVRYGVKKLVFNVNHVCSHTIQAKAFSYSISEFGAEYNF
jgi:hypothetical protein